MFVNKNKEEKNSKPTVNLDDPEENPNVNTITKMFRNAPAKREKPKRVIDDISSYVEPEESKNGNLSGVAQNKLRKITTMTNNAGEA